MRDDCICAYINMMVLLEQLGEHIVCDIGQLVMPLSQPEDGGYSKSCAISSVLG